MDLESFETMDLEKSREMEDELKHDDQVEYWEIEDIKVIKRKL